MFGFCNMNAGRKKWPQTRCEMVKLNASLKQKLPRVAANKLAFYSALAPLIINSGCQKQVR
jgi:hypothetical protein